MKHIALFILIIFISGCSSPSEKRSDIVSDTLTQQIKDTSVQQRSMKADSSVPAVKGSYEEAYNKALMLWDVKLEELEIKTSYGKAHVIACGPPDGEVLVLLHGMNASSTMWYPNVKSLSEHYRIYAIDFFMEPGKSACSSSVNDTRNFVNWYHEIFDGLKLKKFNLVGASRGGWLAVNIALHSPSQINKMVLLSPAQTFVWIVPGPKIIFNLAYAVFPKRKKLRSVMETMTYDIDKIQQSYIDQYYIATKEAGVDKCFLEMTPFSNKELRSLKMPVMVLIGDNDIINNGRSLKNAKHLLPKAETHTIKNAGHFLSVDQPEVVNKLILDFLK
ncbi:MAG: alpha/beta fold hydrolase [Bacteroidia bacterium]